VRPVASPIVVVAAGGTVGELQRRLERLRRGAMAVPRVVARGERRAGVAPALDERADKLEGGRALLRDPLSTATELRANIRGDADARRLTQAVATRRRRRELHPLDLRERQHLATPRHPDDRA